MRKEIIITENSSTEHSQENLAEILETGEMVLDITDLGVNSTDESVLLTANQKKELAQFYLFGAQLQKTSIHDLKNPSKFSVALEAIRFVIKGNRKITKNNLCSVLGINIANIKNHEIGDILREMLKKTYQTDQSQAVNYWDQMATHLHHMIICPDESSLDLDIISMFDLPGERIMRSMLGMRTLSKSEKGLYLRVFTKFDETTGEEFVMALKSLYKIDPQFRDYGELLVTEAIKAMTERTKFFMLLADIQRYQSDGGDMDELWTVIAQNGVVPNQMYFTNFLQNNYRNLYNNVIQEFKDNRNFWEIREVIANNMRNQGQNKHSGEQGQDMSAGVELARLLGSDE